MHRTFTFALAALALTFAPNMVQAQLTYYASSSALSVVAPSLTLDTFSGSGTVATGPYSNSPGLSVTTAQVVSQNLYLHGAGIAPNYFGDSLIFNFSPNDTAIGITVSGDPASGNNQSGSSGQLIADVYLQGSTSPIQTTRTISTFTPYFFGVTSATPITSVKLLFDYNEDAFTDVSSAEYGAVTAPEPSSVALIGLAAALFVCLRRRFAC